MERSISLAYVSIIFPGLFKELIKIKAILIRLVRGVMTSKVLI